MRARQGKRTMAEAAVSLLLALAIWGGIPIAINHFGVEPAQRKAGATP